MKYSVLVAEDDQIIRRLARHILERAGYDVYEAEDGVAALAQIARRKPDLLLLDIMMPKMDGYGVCRALRDENETANLPIVMITAKTEFGSIQKGIEFGVNKYLTKPLSPKVLIDSINDILGVSSKASE